MGIAARVLTRHRSPEINAQYMKQYDVSRVAMVNPFGRSPYTRPLDPGSRTTTYREIYAAASAPSGCPSHSESIPSANRGPRNSEYEPTVRIATGECTYKEGGPNMRTH